MTIHAQRFTFMSHYFAEKDPCHPNPCQNGGKCSHDGKGKVECVCPLRFKGEKCEGNIEQHSESNHILK